MQTNHDLDRIHNAFPKLTWHSARDTSNGWDHRVFILDDAMVFRIPKAKEYKEKLSTEIRLLGYLGKKTSLNIPQYRYVSKKDIVAGYPIIPGKPLLPSLFRRLRGSDKRLIARQIAGFLTVLHKTPRSVITKYAVPPTSPEANYRTLLRKMKRYVYPKLSSEEIHLIEEYFEEVKNTLKPEYRPVLIHNDFIPEHLFWDNKTKKVGVIDFSDREYGDPAADFFSLWQYGKKCIQEVYDLYGGKKDNQFLDRSLLYFKRVPLSLMCHSFTSKNCTFEDGYKMFQERWK